MNGVSFGKRDDGSLWLSIGDPESGPHVQSDWEFGEHNLRVFANALRFPRFHPATWIHSLPSGALELSIPLPVASDDIDNIERLFALIVSRLRRDLIPQANSTNPEAPAGGNK